MAENLSVLVVDTATRRAIVALVRGGIVVAEAFHEQPTTHAERLVAMTTEVLERSGAGLESIDRLAIGMGPGSFTGVRVGMGFAKGLGFAGGIGGVGVMSLEAMAYAARRIVGARRVFSLLDAKKGEVFVASFDGQGRRGLGPEHLARDRVQRWMDTVEPWGKRVVVGEVAEELDLRNVELIRDRSCDLPGAEAMAALAVARAASDDLALLEPLYVRPPDITQPAG